MNEWLWNFIFSFCLFMWVALIIGSAILAVTGPSIFMGFVAILLLSSGLATLLRLS